MTGRKLLFTDLDGTLLNDRKEITPGNRKAVNQALDQGHGITIATGRPLQSGIMVAHELGLDKQGCYLIAYNGAAIYDFGKQTICQEKTMSREQLTYLFAEACKEELYIQTYSDTALWTQKDCRELQYYYRASRMPYEIHSDIPNTLPVLPHKILLIELDKKEKLEQFQREHQSWQEGKCISIFSTDEYLEYCPLGATKGDGIRFLANHLGVSMEHTIAVGDERNDMSMLEAAGLGVAMSNSREIVKQAANTITHRDNNHDGVAEVISKYLLDEKSC